MMFQTQRAEIWSIQPFPFLNPACSSLNLLSTMWLSLLMIILARILLGMESTVIPRQLLQLFNAHFFRILIMVAWFLSSGILLSSQIFIMRGRWISAAIAGSVLKSCALRLSGPGALLFFRALMALIISSLEGGDVSISRSSTASGMSGSVSGGGRFNISLKYSAHCASCVFSDIYSFPSLSFIGVSKFFLNCPQTCFVILYSVAWSPLCAASSPWVSISSRYLRLSRRISCLTVRSASLYTCFYCSLSRSDFIPSNFCLMFLLSSIFNLLTSNLLCPVCWRSVLLSFSRILALTRWWSLPTSAPLLTQMSSRERLHVPLIAMWSIWFLSCPLGEIHVSLWVVGCGKRVPPITMLLSAQKSTSRSPLLFIVPHPWPPMVLSTPRLSSPAFALMSPITMMTSWHGISSSSTCNC